MEESDHHLFTDIIISKDMITDHFPINYEARWNLLLNNNDFWNNRAGLELRDSLSSNESPISQNEIYIAPDPVLQRE